MTAVRTLRPRRSNLAVPGSNPRFLEKARGLPADQVFLDLEDACAPLAKPGARKNIVAALNEGGWGDKIRAVRVNDWTTQWTYRPDFPRESSTKSQYAYASRPGSFSKTHAASEITSCTSSCRPSRRGGGNRRSSRSISTILT